MAVLIIDCYIGLFGTSFMQVLYLGRAPRTKETLPNFLEKCRVTRHSRVFRGLTGSQRTPGDRGVTVSDVKVLSCSDDVLISNHTIIVPYGKEISIFNLCCLK